MEKQKRASCFVDGFNLFHAIDALKPTGNPFKWLDLRKLTNAFIQPSKEYLKDVFYFSAYPTWRPKSLITHRLYVEALQSVGVTCILGHFKEKQRQCISCKAIWQAHEEKESDVNLAIHLLHQAYLNSFDKAFIITADSDLVPAVQLVLDTFPTKEVVILTPPKRFNVARNLRGQFKVIKIKQTHLKNSRLPAIIQIKNNVIKIPEKYSFIEN